METDSVDGADDGEHSHIEFVAASNIFQFQAIFLLK